MSLHPAPPSLADARMLQERSRALIQRFRDLTETGIGRGAPRICAVTGEDLDAASARKALERVDPRPCAYPHLSDFTSKMVTQRLQMLRDLEAGLIVEESSAAVQAQGKESGRGKKKPVERKQRRHQQQQQQQQQQEDSQQQPQQQQQQQEDSQQQQQQPQLERRTVSGPSPPGALTTQESPVDEGHAPSTSGFSLTLTGNVSAQTPLPLRRNLRSASSPSVSGPAASAAQVERPVRQLRSSSRSHASPKVSSSEPAATAAAASRRSGAGGGSPLADDDRPRISFAELNQSWKAEVAKIAERCEAVNAAARASLKFCHDPEADFPGHRRPKQNFAAVEIARRKRLAATHDAESFGDSSGLHVSSNGSDSAGLLFGSGEDVVVGVEGEPAAKRPRRRSSRQASKASSGSGPATDSDAPRDHARKVGIAPHGHVLDRESEVVFTIHVFHPARKNKTQVWEMLGTHPLSALADRISCPRNRAFPEDRGAFFFIEDTFFPDRREGVQDTASSLVAWCTENVSLQNYDESARYPPYATPFADSHRATVLMTAGLTSFTPQGVRMSSMEATLMDIPSLRLNQAYLFRHQESHQHLFEDPQDVCEHNFVITNVRVMHKSDPALESEFPLLLFQHGERRRACTACTVSSAEFITWNSTFSPTNPCFYCWRCFEALHYDKDGILLEPNLKVSQYIHA